MRDPISMEASTPNSHDSVANAFSPPTSVAGQMPVVFRAALSHDADASPFKSRIVTASANAIINTNILKSDLECSNIPAPETPTPAAANIAGLMAGQKPLRWARGAEARSSCAAHFAGDGFHGSHGSCAAGAVHHPLLLEAAPRLSGRQSEVGRKGCHAWAP
jgi:hypothetical protein